MIVHEQTHTICDRCKAKINLNRRDIPIFHAQRPILNGSLIRKDINDGKEFPRLYFELCSKCADEFEKWRKEVKPEDTESHNKVK